MPKYFDLTEGKKWQWFISFDYCINLWKKMKTFQSLETDECQNYGNLSNLSCIWWVFEFATKSIEFKIQRQAIWIVKVLWRILKHKMSVSRKNITLHCPRVLQNWEENVIFPPKRPQIFRESLILNGNVFSRHSLLESK